MKPHDCSCPVCTPRPKPTAFQGVLLPRIMASGRTWLRRQCFTLHVDGLPVCAQPPFALISVSPCGDPTWESQPNPHSLCFQVSIPLLCQVRDGCGSVHCCHAHIHITVTLSPCCPIQECWRCCMMVLPCVRLVCADCSHTACFEVQLEVLAEAYLLRWEPCATPQPCKPACPDLPLYPQPCYPQ